KKRTKMEERRNSPKSKKVKPNSNSNTNINVTYNNNLSLHVNIGNDEIRSFSSQTTSSSVSLLLFIPKELWQQVILSYLTLKEKGILRLISKWFRNEILSFPFWKQSIPIEFL